jgi:hypothetical protein
VDLSGPAAAITAELVERGLDPAGLAARIAAARERIASAFDAVVAAGTIDALSD